jgi:hypothetical protein
VGQYTELLHKFKNTYYSVTRAFCTIFNKLAMQPCDREWIKVFTTWINSVNNPLQLKLWKVKEKCSSCAWFQALATTYMRSSSFQDVRQCWLVVSHWYFEQAYQSHLQGSSFEFVLCSFIHGITHPKERKVVVNSYYASAWRNSCGQSETGDHLTLLWQKRRQRHILSQPPFKDCSQENFLKV